MVQDAGEWWYIYIVVVHQLYPLMLRVLEYGYIYIYIVDPSYVFQYIGVKLCIGTYIGTYYYAVSFIICIHIMADAV